MNRLIVLLFALLPLFPLAAAELPRDSVYRLDAGLVDQDGKPLRFPSFAGDVRVVTMFYANCPYVCPMIVETLKRTERELDTADRTRFRVLMLTLDPERDTPAALRKVADERKLDTARYTLARSEPKDVRKLAALLGIQYRQLENRDFNHSSALVLIDAQGRVLARSSRIGEADPE
ncbi:MAG TPA: SCO family protein, partial [Xanthomonadales bacterium]|nr:SCO family protein [Xanthomonadales bacterium]